MNLLLRFFFIFILFVSLGQFSKISSAYATSEASLVKLEDILKNGTSEKLQEQYKQDFPEHIKLCYLGLINEYDHTHALMLIRNTHIERKEITVEGKTKLYPYIANNKDRDSNGVLVSYVKYASDRYFYLIPEKSFFTLHPQDESFTDVEIKDKSYKKSFQEQMSKEKISLNQVIAKRSVGFHLAIRLKRGLHCLNIPITASERETLVEKINQKNLSLAKKEITKEEFSVLANNCTHQLVNLLSHIGLVKPVSTSLTKALLSMNFLNPDLVLNDILYGIANKNSPNHWREKGTVIEYLPKIRGSQNPKYSERENKDLVFRDSLFFNGEYKKRGTTFFSKISTKKWLKKNRDYLLI